MFVREIAYDQWSGSPEDRASTDEGGCIEEPSQEVLEDCLAKLDGQFRTVLTLRSPDEDSLMSIGRWGSKFYVWTTVDRVQNWTLVGDRAAIGEVTLCLGGQDSFLPARNIVGQEQVRAAALAYFRTGERISALEWELEG